MNNRPPKWDTFISKPNTEIITDVGLGMGVKEQMGYGVIVSD